MAKRYSTTLQAPSDIPMGKHVAYNRETMDYDAFFDRQYIGSRESMEAARELVNEYVYDLERSGMMYTATELDGAQEDTDAIIGILTTAEKRAIGREADEVLAVHFQQPAVTSARWALDDELDERHGQELGTDYECGKAGLYIPDDGGRLVFGFFEETSHELDQQGAAELLALLENPRMRAHLTRWFANAPTNTPAVTDTRTSAYEQGRKDGMVEGFAFGYSKALDQVEQYLKENQLAKAA